MPHYADGALDEASQRGDQAGVSFRPSLVKGISGEENETGARSELASEVAERVIEWVRSEVGTLLFEKLDAKLVDLLQPELQARSPSPGLAR